MFIIAVFITILAIVFPMILFATYNIFSYKKKTQLINVPQETSATLNNEATNSPEVIIQPIEQADSTYITLPNKNIEASTIVEKTEVNNYDFSSLSQTFNYLVIFIIAFFIGRLIAILFRSLNKKFTTFKQQKNTISLMKEFDSVITNEELIISYANKIEEQSIINTILIKRGSSLKLEVLNHDLNNKKEIIRQIINKKYILD